MNFLDTVISGGTVFDGRGGPGLRADVGIKDGEIVVLSESPLPIDPGRRASTRPAGG